MSPQRPSGRRFAAFVAALGFGAAALGAVALPRLADESVPASLKAKPAAQKPVEQKLADRRCGRDRQVDRVVDAPT